MHLGSLGCNGLAPSYLFFLPSEDHSQRKIKSSFACPSFLSLLPFLSRQCPSCSFPFLLIFVSASQTQSAQENPLSFLLFPFLFQKSECSSPLMQDILFPYVCSHINSFFLTKYFSYLFECTYLSES